MAERVSPEATDHPGPHVLISNEASQEFATPRRCVLVPRAASGTEAGTRTRPRARSLGSIEPQAESSKKRILRLLERETKITANKRGARERVVETQEATAGYSERDKNPIGETDLSSRCAGSSGRKRAFGWGRGEIE